MYYNKYIHFNLIEWKQTMQPLSGSSKTPDEIKSKGENAKVDESQAKVNDAAKSPLSSASQTHETTSSLNEIAARRKEQTLARMESESNVNLETSFSGLEKLGLFNPNIKTEAEMLEALKNAHQKTKRDVVFAFMKTDNPNEIVFCGYHPRHGYTQETYRYINKRGGYLEDSRGNSINNVLDILKSRRLPTDLEVFSPPPVIVEKKSVPLTNESAKEELTRLKWYSSEMAKREAQLQNGLYSAVTENNPNPFVFRDATDVGFTIMYVKDGRVLKDKFQIKDGKWTKWPTNVRFDSVEQLVRSLGLDPNYKYFN